MQITVFACNRNKMSGRFTPGYARNTVCVKYEAEDLLVVMSTPPKRKGKAFWSRVEQTGETMEIGMRCFLGFVFAFVLASVAWWIGSHVWVGVAVVVAILAFPVGFLIGFFWLEVKFLLRLFFGSLLD